MAIEPLAVAHLSTTFKNIWSSNSNRYSKIAGVGEWSVERSNVKREELIASSNPMGYARESLIHLEPTSCPPDLLHMTNGVILKQFNQVYI